MAFRETHVTKANCRAKVLINFFVFSEGKCNYTTDKDGEAIESVPENKDAVPTRETASKKSHLEKEGI